MIEKNARLAKDYIRPPPEEDCLYHPHHKHAEPSLSCIHGCSKEAQHLVHRVIREQDHDSPVIHYGRIASGNKLIKDAVLRDKVHKEHEILCFEMEAEGLVDTFPCLVIRGICDYSDTHKNDRWHGYAAAAAAAYAKELLYEVQGNSFPGVHHMYSTNSLRQEGYGSGLGQYAATPPLPTQDGHFVSYANTPRSLLQDWKTESNPNIPLVLQDGRPHGLTREPSTMTENSSASSVFFPTPDMSISSVSSQDAAVPRRSCLSLNTPLPISTLTMREEEIHQIDQWFQSKPNDGPTILKMALKGMGGCGKTQLAAKHCHDATKKKSYDYIFWLNVASPSLLASDLKQVANQMIEELKITSDDLRDDEKCRESLKHLLQNPDKSWLIVTDNLDDPELFGNDLAKYIPRSGDGRVLVTSQRDDHALKGILGYDSKVIDVERMDPAEAERLLALKASDLDVYNGDGTFDLDEGERFAWKRLLNELQYHALSVDIMASHIVTGTFGIVDVIQQLNKDSTPLTLSNDTAYDRTPEGVCKLSLSRIAGPEGDLKTSPYIDILAIFVHICDHPIDIRWFQHHAEEAAKLGESRPWMKPFMNKDGSWNSIEFGKALKELSKRSIIKVANGRRDSATSQSFATPDMEHSELRRLSSESRIPTIHRIKDSDSIKSSSVAPSQASTTDDTKNSTHKRPSLTPSTSSSKSPSLHRFKSSISLRSSSPSPAFSAAQIPKLNDSPDPASTKVPPPTQTFTMHHIMRHVVASQLTRHQQDSSLLDAIIMIFLWWQKLSGPGPGDPGWPQVYEIQTLLITTCSGSSLSALASKDDIYDFKYLDQVGPTTKRLQEWAKAEGYPKCAWAIWKARKTWQCYQLPRMVGYKTFGRHKSEQILESFMPGKRGKG